MAIIEKRTDGLVDGVIVYERPNSIVSDSSYKRRFTYKRFNAEIVETE